MDAKMRSDIEYRIASALGVWGDGALAAAFYTLAIADLPLPRPRPPASGRNTTATAAGAVGGSGADAVGLRAAMRLKYGLLASPRVSSRLFMCLDPVDLRGFVIQRAPRLVGVSRADGSR